MITENTCAIYIQAKKMPYVNESMEYCKFNCSGNKEDCMHKDYELNYKSIKDTRICFRKGSLAMVVMGENEN